MTWLFAIILAAFVFAAMVFLFKLPRASWLVVAAALAFGLAGYATQATPGLASASAQPAATESQEGPLFVELRKAFIGMRQRSGSAYILMSDEWVRRADYEGAVTLLRGVVYNNQRDGDAWLALANALYLHADGTMTPAAAMAYERADQELTGNLAPAFFIGATMIRDGNLIDAHQLWSERLAEAPADAPGRELLQLRLDALEQLMRGLVANAGQDAE